MDFQKFVDTFTTATCVISVEKLPDNDYGEIRIVTGNKAYVDSIEQVGEGPRLMLNKFVPNSEYQNYFPKDLNFEDFCYKSAILKQPQHSYVHPDRFDFWFDLFSLPLESDDEKLAYCTYTQVVSHKPNTEKMSNLSYDTSSDVLSACLKLKSSDDFNTAVKDLVQRLREICDSQYCCIMLMNIQDRTCHLLGESFSEDEEFNENDDWMDGHFFDVAETWEDLIGGSNCLIIKNKADWDYLQERNKPWCDELIYTGVKTMVLFPLRKNGNLLGYIWATNFTPENAGRIKEILELSSLFISAEISNHLLFDRLKVLSTIDSLTGVMNRNEMNNRVDEIAGNPELGDKSVGIIFIDLNGLKRTNDERGHLAGDILLKEAASILKNLFGQDEIYRAGGDEFMVLSFGTTEEALNKKIAELRKQVELSDTVSFAIGSFFDPNSNNILSAMTKADKRMYDDKELYYAEHPEKKR
ncbi:MAG: sensor domain-containing diguanylate cyclase [Treponema sp.]|nr:sensor domain-containing diguanylate cyclase [Treponema sp.]